jgi:hypothetical protein
MVLHMHEAVRRSSIMLMIISSEGNACGACEPVEQLCSVPKKPPRIELSATCLAY